MYYIIYLASMFLLLLGAACSSSIASPPQFFPSQLFNYIDIWSLAFILVPCLLVLLSTKSFRNFGHSFLIMFGKKKTISEDNVHSVGSVMITSVIAGAIHAIIVIIHLLRGMDLSGVGASYLGNSINVALLSLLYPLVLCIILLPVLVTTRKQARTNSAVQSPRAKNKK